MEKKPATAPTAATSHKKLPKKIVALKLLTNRSLIQPEAHDIYGESCLHSTISDLWNIHGIAFARVPEKYRRHDARFTRYTLQEHCRERVLQLVALYDRKRAA